MLTLILLGLIASMIEGASIPAVAADLELVQPQHMIVDASLPKPQVDEQILAARRYDTF